MDVIFKGCPMVKAEMWMIVNDSQQQDFGFFRKIPISLILDDSTTFFPGR